MPRIEIKDWRTACIDKKLYSRPSTFNRSLERMAERKLVFLDSGNTFICTASNYLEYKEKGYEF
jgi:hypothetical protein